VPEIEKINEIVVDNMDTFYCSPTVANMLTDTPLHFPKVVVLAKGNTKRGDYHIAVNSKDGAVAGSGHDGVPVNFITTADPSDGETTVTRKIDGVQQEVKSHIAIKRYNRFMQAVDRNVQLRVEFSLATRYAFKRYYIKYFSSLFDICMTNAMVH
jgi:hypothetical protein